MTRREQSEARFVEYIESLAQVLAHRVRRRRASPTRRRRGRFGFGWPGTATRLSNRGAICGSQVELDFVFEEADVRHD
jgi:hypothetical protein